ncbi:MAG TPA: carboxypeptidase-like regulatory domain-containing protein [Saprospiraceae bacterium]|nr:carboxypeptidase-like regulatory domain-containing protein [Saprospiraceae bacterium]
MKETFYKATKKRKIRRVILFLSGISFFIFQCHKSEDNSGYVDVKDPPFKKIQATVIGQVFDEYSKPIPEAIVQLGDQTTTSDLHGVYTFKSIIAPQDNSVITVKKEGFFPQVYFAPLFSGDISYSSAMMRRKAIAVKFSPSQGINYNFFEQLKFQILPNSLLNSKKEIEKGTVSLDATLYRAKLNDQYLSQLPALAKQKDGSYKMLEFFAVTQLEFLNEMIEQVYPISYIPIEVSMPRLDLQDQSMRTYFFDQDEKIWVEDSIVTVENGKYKTVIKNWNRFAIAIPHSYCAVDGKVSWNNHSAEWINVELESNIGLVRQIKSSYKGLYRLLVPKSIPSKLFYNDACNQQRQFVQINPTTTDHLSQNIEIDNTQYFSQLKGTITNCIGAEIEDGYLLIQYPQGSTTLLPIAQASYFETSLYPCSEQKIQLIAYDIQNREFSVPQFIDPTYNGNQFIQTCRNQVTGFGRFKLDEQTNHSFTKCTLQSFPQSATLLQSYQIEWESATGMELYLLQQNSTPNQDKFWVLISTNVAANQYEFPQIIPEPEVLEIQENGVSFVELFIQGVRVKHKPTQKLYSNASLYIKAIKK